MRANESRPTVGGTASKLLGGGLNHTIPRTSDTRAWRRAQFDRGRFLTLDQAADHGDTNKRTVRRLIRAGVLPAYRFRGGKAVRVLQADVEALALADELMSVTRAAAAVNVSDNMIHRAIRDGVLLAHHDGRSRGARVRWSDVLALMTPATGAAVTVSEVTDEPGLPVVGGSPEAGR